MTRENPLAQLPDDWRDILIKEYSEGASDTEVRDVLGITYNKWKQLKDDVPEFFDIVVLGQQSAKAFWLRAGRLNIDNNKFNAFLWYRNMQNRFGWSDKQTSNIDGPASRDEAEGYDDSEADDILHDLIREQGASKH